MTRRPASSCWPALLAAATCGIALGAAPLRASEPDDEQVLDFIQHRMLAVFQKCQGAIARIEASDANGKLFGTGFFIDPSGTLYTSYSIGGETHDIVVSLGGAKYPARRLIGDARSGVAILQVEAQTPFLNFAKPGELHMASPVMAIGYPMDLAITPTFGVVGGFDIMYLGRYFATSHIRANVPVQRGQGGAPLLNLRGEVVGLLISSLDNGSASFVLPIAAAEKVRRDYVRFHEVRPGWLGIQVGSAETPPTGRGVEIEGLAADSPGEKAGLIPGDMLLQVGEHPVRSPREVVDASFFLTAEDELTVTVQRGAQRLDIRVQPIDHPLLGHASAAPDPANDLRLPAIKIGK